MTNKNIISEDWVEILYKDAVYKVSTTKTKLKQKDYLQSGRIPVVDQGQSTIGGYTEDENRILNCRLPVIIFGDHTKRIKLIDFHFAPGADGTKVLEPKNGLIPKYIALLTEILVFKIKDKGYARHYQHIEKQYFPLPPLPIQRAIVTKIENLLASLDKGIADLKKAQEQLKIYRQAVLKKAFEGEWEIVELKSVVDELSQGWSPKCKNMSSTNDEEWAVIKTSSIQHGFFNENENKVLPENLEPRKQHEIKYGDILITRAGPRNRVGVCCLIKKTRPKLINCDKVYRLRLSDNILNDYFMYNMNSSEFLTKIEEIKTGGNDSGVNLTQNRFLNLELKLPPVNLQHQIVKEIESRLSVCDKVEQSIAEALEKSEALRQSILKKAFEGKLLSEEEIEKCKQEADYEPASVLLERIKKEKKK